jgi:hypothetical protein
VVIFVTFFSVIYVYQQNEIFRLGYIGQKRQAHYEELLDNNKILRYNIQQSSSLVRLQDKLSGYSDFQIPDTFKLVRVTHQGIEENSTGRETLLSRIFSIRRQAEAKTSSP